MFTRRKQFKERFVRKLSPTLKKTIRKTEMKKIHIRAIDLERLGIEIVYVCTEDPKLLEECEINANLIKETFANTEEDNKEN